MYTFEKKLREGRYKQERQNPSFSSTLLDEIYRSIDDEKGGRIKKEDLKFYRETMGKKQSTRDGYRDSKATRQRGDEVEERMTIQHAKLKVREEEKRKVSKEFHQGKYRCHDDDHEKDALLFSSASSSFDSSSGGFSSSDAESLHGLKPNMSCFVPTRPKPVRTTVPTRSEKKDRTMTQKQQEKALKTEGALFQEQRRKLHTFDDYHYNSASDQNQKKLDDSLIKSKSRALRIYSNLKKMKQPISPGGRLTSFLNNLFTAGHTKKAKQCLSSVGGYDDVRTQKRYNLEQATTCSSASSFARSCLSKNSPSTREKLRNADKRTVRFCPVSVTVDEDSRPCGQKGLYHEEDHHSVLMPVSVPTAWRIGKSPSRKVEEGVKSLVMERNKKIEEMARDFLKDHHYAVNHKKNDAVLRDVMHKRFHQGYEYKDDEDDAASCSSSDLFELDHLSVIEKHRFDEELPVYETTSVDTNRAISRLVM